MCATPQENVQIGGQHDNYITLMKQKKLVMIHSKATKSVLWLSAASFIVTRLGNTTPPNLSEKCLYHVFPSTGHCSFAKIASERVAVAHESSTFWRLLVLLLCRESSLGPCVYSWTFSRSCRSDTVSVLLHSCHILCQQACSAAVC